MRCRRCKVVFDQDETEDEGNSGFCGDCQAVMPQADEEDCGYGQMDGTWAEGLDEGDEF